MVCEEHFFMKCGTSTYGVTMYYEVIIVNINKDKLKHFTMIFNINVKHLPSISMKCVAV